MISEENGIDRELRDNGGCAFQKYLEKNAPDGTDLTHSFKSISLNDDVPNSTNGAIMQNDKYERSAANDKKDTTGAKNTKTTIDTTDGSGSKYPHEHDPKNDSESSRVTEGIEGIQKLTKEEKYGRQVEADSRSIFVGNITPEVTPEIIEEHFKHCGVAKRITLLYDKNTGAPKGYAYVEFDKQSAQEKALELHGTELRGSNINVYKKRTNLPGYRRHFSHQRQNFYVPQQWNFTQSGQYQDFNEIGFRQELFQHNVFQQTLDARHDKRSRGLPRANNKARTRKHQNNNLSNHNSNENGLQ